MKIFVSEELKTAFLYTQHHHHLSPANNNNSATLKREANEMVQSLLWCSHADADGYLLLPYFTSNTHIQNEYDKFAFKDIRSRFHLSLSIYTRRLYIDCNLLELNYVFVHNSTYLFILFFDIGLRHVSPYHKVTNMKEKLITIFHDLEIRIYC